MMTNQDMFEIFNDFLDQYIYYLCTRCCRLEKFPKLHDNIPIIRRTGGVHHDGLILNMIKPAKELSDKCINAFITDHEHGLFHGIMTAFVGYVIARLADKNTKDLESFFATATLHDFAKTNGHGQETHDQQLRIYFDNLTPDVYSHSSDVDISKLMIVSDRIELRRYADHKSWVDKRYYEVIAKIGLDSNHLFNHFYDIIRPAMLLLYRNKNSVFIRHGIEQVEKVNYKTDTIFPPDGSYYPMNSAYPIELDRVPFGHYPQLDIKTGKQYVHHKYVNTSYNKIFTHCSDHGVHGPQCSFNTVKGYIPTQWFKYHNGKIVHSQKRDHLYAKSAIHPRNWTFLYQGVDAENKQVKQLIEHKYRVVPQQTVILFFNLVKLFTDRLIALNIM